MPIVTNQIEGEVAMRQLADTLNGVVKDLFGDDAGFALLTFQLGDSDGVANYISNGSRDDMIHFLRETLQRFENNETIPAGVGSVN